MISEAAEADNVAGIGPVLDEFKKLFHGLPPLGRASTTGPPIEMPRDLAFYWEVAAVGIELAIV